VPGLTVDRNKDKAHVNLADYDPEAIYTDIISDDVDAFAFPEESFAGFYEFMSRSLPNTVRAVKGQITGPVSMGLQTIDQNDKPVIYDEAYAEIMRKNLNLMARWQERELRKKCSQTIMFIDEPFLSIIGTPFASVPAADAVSWINEVMGGLEGLKGIHCCANTDWPLVMSTNADLLSFDGFDYGHTLALYPEEVSQFLERGGIIAWGVVPNNEEVLGREDAASVAAQVEKLLRSLSDKGISEEMMLSQSIITPQCGLSGLDEGGAARVLDLLVEVSDRLRAEHSLE